MLQSECPKCVVEVFEKQNFYLLTTASCIFVVIYFNVFLVETLINVVIPLDRSHRDDKRQKIFFPIIQCFHGRVLNPTVMVMTMEKMGIFGSVHTAASTGNEKKKLFLSPQCERAFRVGFVSGSGVFIYVTGVAVYNGRCTRWCKIWSLLNCSNSHNFKEKTKTIERLSRCCRGIP